jgi:hypothetical protein
MPSFEEPSMSKRISLLLAASVALAIASRAYPATPVAPVTPSVPATALAARSTDVIERATRAIVALEGESRIRKLWVFPTAEPNTVFVHYRTTTDVDAHEPGPTVEHLVMLELDGTRIAKLQDLTTTPSSIVAAADKPGANDGSANR